VSESTRYAPIKLLDWNPRPDIFSKLLKKASDQLPVEDTLAEKLLKAYGLMNLKSEDQNRKRKKGRTNWKHKVNYLTLVTRQPAADAAQGVSSKYW
jgi:hypothetical protein